MIAFQILAIVFVVFFFLSSLFAFLLYWKYIRNKKRELKLKAKCNYLQAINFEVRQSDIDVLSEYNNQIEPICNYSLNFSQEYFHSLKVIEIELRTLASLNNNFHFSAAKQIEDIIVKNFEIIEKALYKHDRILAEATFSFDVISRIAVFYQAIVKDIITNFEESLSVNHNGIKITSKINELSSLLIALEQNKVRNDSTEVEQLISDLAEKTKSLIDYLKSVHVILMAKSYLKSSINKIQEMVEKYDDLKSGKEIVEIEKAIMKLWKHYEKISEENIEYEVEQKKFLISDSLKILRAINKKINYTIATRNINPDIVRTIFSWIYFFETNNDYLVKLFKNILQFVQTENHALNDRIHRQVYKINHSRMKLIEYKEQLKNDDYYKSLSATAYIEKIREIFNEAINFKNSVLELNHDLQHVFRNTLKMMVRINSYKLSLIILNGKIRQLKTPLKLPYKPIALIAHLNNLEIKLRDSITQDVVQEEINSQILEVGYKIMEMGALMSNNQKLLIYSKKLIIKFNKFHNEPKYYEALNEAIKYYASGDFYKMVKELIASYNRFNTKYIQAIGTQ